MTNNTTFPGTLTCPTSSVSNAMTMGTTKTYVVTVSDASGANKYYIDGYLQASLVLHQNQTYIFDLSSSTLSGHPFEFSTTNNGSHGGGSAYSTGITTTGTYADDQTRTFVVSTSTPTTLYYYCTAHSGMGGSVTISPKAELIVSGGAEFIGTGTIKLPSGTTSERPATGINGMIRYNTTTGYMESYTQAGWGSIASPPVVTDVSPVTVAGGDTATQVLTVTGTGFDPNLVIKLVGADGTEYSVFSTTYVSGTSATFKMGANGASGGYDVAQKPFKVRVTGGSGLTSTLDTPTITIPVPTITGVSPNNLTVGAVGSQTITVTGTNFTSSMASGNNIQVLGADGSTLYNVDSAAVASATSITFKLAATGASLSSGQLANRPYKVKVTGGAGATATSTQTIGFSGGVSWTSPAASSTMGFSSGESKSFSLVATDEVGGTGVTFSIVSGGLSGLSIGSTGASPATYSGTANGDASSTLVVRITDNVTGTTADRSFTVAVATSLYPFTSHTFSSGGGTTTSGRYGRSFPSYRSYGPAPWAPNTSYFTQGTTTGYQLWTVPATATYRIKAAGAAGGRNSSPSTGQYGGRGAIVEGDFALQKNNKIQIVVGQMATDQTGSPEIGSGGGGGTFVFKQSYTAGNVSDVYVIAGGGGGVGYSSARNNRTGIDGVLANAADGADDKGARGGWTSGGGAGWDASNPSAGGGGYYTMGRGVTDGYFVGGGITGWPVAFDYNPDPNSFGGFGGGGGGSLYQGAGGGGYGGGGAGAANSNGGGGTSKSTSTIRTAFPGYNNTGYNGYVTITKL